MVGLPRLLQDQRFRDLMRAAQTGNRAAYDILLREIIPVVRGFLASRAKAIPTPDLDDLIQDVLMSVHQARPTYDPARPFFPWLFAIARNRLSDRGRQQGKFWKNEIAVEQLPETSVWSDSNITVEAYGDPEALRIAMADLTPGQRAAVNLLKIRELSLAEASHESGVSSIALRVAVHRAIKALRVKLSGADR